MKGVEEPVEITLEEALNHGDNYVEFTYDDQEFDAIVNYVDEDVVEIEEAIKAEEDAITALPENVIPETLEEVKAQVAEAKELVRIAQELDENVVFDEYPLEQAEEGVADFGAKEEAATVVGRIKDLPLAKDITQDNKGEAIEAVEAARAAYDALSDEAKVKVDNLNFLENREAKIEALGVNDLIARIGSNEEVEGDYTERVNEARAAYDALTEKQKESVSESNVTKLETAEAKIEVAALITITEHSGKNKNRVYVAKGNSRPADFDENLGGFMDVTFATDNEAKEINVVAEVNGKTYDLVAMTGDDLEEGDKVFHIGFQIGAFDDETELVEEFFTNVKEHGGEVTINVIDMAGNTLEKDYTMEIDNYPGSEYVKVQK